MILLLFYEKKMGDYQGKHGWIKVHFRKKYKETSRSQNIRVILILRREIRRSWEFFSNSRSLGHFLLAFYFQVVYSTS
ncbi:Uncharacterized protein dnm_059550 [Desulfonema magnum]|uniref:Uncharacterized protein n=1 Tax=Desulfonema magnum TaxID=45655 RepID=A0A975BQM8_9BACT|nr:Uncharacterized protein dnm_059550 [Desulfonema magnum]